MPLPSVNSGPSVGRNTNTNNNLSSMQANALLERSTRNDIFHLTILETMHEVLSDIKDVLVKQYNHMIGLEEDQRRDKLKQNDLNNLRDPIEPSEKIPLASTGPQMGLNVGQAALLAVAAWAFNFDTAIKALNLPMMVKEVVNGVKAIGTWIAGVFDITKIKRLQRAAEGFTQAFNAYERGFANLAKNWIKVVELGWLGKATIKLGEWVTRLKGVFSPVTSVFSKIFVVARDTMTWVSKLGGFFAPIAKMAKYIGGPVTMLVLGIIDFFTGFVNGWKNGSLFDGLKGGVDELMRGFITKPLDLVKDIISWLTEKLGWESISKSLDSFSFTELFNEYVVKWRDRFLDFVFDPSQWVQAWESLKSFPGIVGAEISAAFKSATDWVYDKFNSITDDLKKVFEDFSLTDLVTEAVTDVKKFFADALDFVMPNLTMPTWFTDLGKLDLFGGIVDRLNNSTMFDSLNFSKSAWPLNKIGDIGDQIKQTLISAFSGLTSTPSPPVMMPPAPLSPSIIPSVPPGVTSMGSQVGQRSETSATQQSTVIVSAPTTRIQGGNSTVVSNVHRNTYMPSSPVNSESSFRRARTAFG